MNRGFLETTVFRDRRFSYDPSEGGKLMEIFRTPVRRRELRGECSQLHAIEIFLRLFFGIPLEEPETQTRKTAGIIFLAVSAGKLPQKWHVEHLADRWFKEVPQDDGSVELVTECRLVVDEWRDI